MARSARCGRGGLTTAKTQAVPRWRIDVPREYASVEPRQAEPFRKYAQVIHRSCTAFMFRCARLDEDLHQVPEQYKVVCVIEETIQQIERRLRAADELNPNERAELEELIAQLRREARSLPPNALASATSASDQDAQSMVNRLQESLTAFETSHPELIGLVNRISTILANMGL